MSRLEVPNGTRGQCVCGAWIVVGTPEMEPHRVCGDRYLQALERESRETYQVTGKIFWTADLLGPER
jgi:hypothetical protein